MTWQAFVAAVESKGVKDEDEIVEILVPSMFADHEREVFRTSDGKVEIM